MHTATPQEEVGTVELPLGKTVGRRWKVMDKLGEGGCGTVYLVEDTKSKARAAMKAEFNFVAGGSVLKLEVQVLKRMVGRKFVAQLISSGKKERYSYMVMTLFGASLSKLFKQCHREFSVSTQVRVGMQILYGLKQLHEVGYIHRDIKPANLAVGRRGSEARMVHLLDFGLAREYVLRNEGKVEIRRPREITLFRGTTKYCSAHSHSKSEQGRPDDLWAMMYVLAEMRGKLPWDHLKEKKDIGRNKNSTSDVKLLEKSPPEMLLITQHLRTLDYYTRPNYQLIFDILVKMLTKYNIQYSDPFDWETLGLSITPGKSKFRKKMARINTVSEDVSVPRTVDKDSTDKAKEQTAEESVDVNQLPFASEAFSKNELGF